MRKLLGAAAVIALTFTVTPAAQAATYKGHMSHSEYKRVKDNQTRYSVEHMAHVRGKLTNDAPASAYYGCDPQFDNCVLVHAGRERTVVYRGMKGCSGSKVAIDYVLDETDGRWHVASKDGYYCQ